MEEIDVWGISRQPVHPREVGSQASHAHPEMSVIDPATGSAASPARSTRHTPRTRRSLVLGGLLMAAIDACMAIARRALARHRRRRQARDVYDALRHLDDRTLRDLGFDRSEIASVAAEVAREAESTRRRVTNAPAGVPKESRVTMVKNRALVGRWA